MIAVYLQQTVVIGDLHLMLKTAGPSHCFHVTFYLLWNISSEKYQSFPIQTLLSFIEVLFHILVCFFLFILVSFMFSFQLLLLSSSHMNFNFTHALSSQNLHSASSYVVEPFFIFSFPLYAFNFCTMHFICTDIHTAFIM